SLPSRRPSAADNITDTIAAVVSGDPDWLAPPPATPAGVRRLLRRCLEKEPKRRLRDVGEARIQIDDVLSSAAEPVTPAPLPQWRRILPWAAASGLVVALAGLSYVYFRDALPTSLPELRLEITTPATDHPASFGLSPDGRMIVFTATSDGQPRLWLRSLDSTSARPLRGTEDGVFPFWSPDSRS